MYDSHALAYSLGVSGGGILDCRRIFPATLVCAKQIAPKNIIIFFKSVGKTEKKLDRRSIKVNMLTLMLLFDRRSKPEPVSDGLLKGSVCRLCCADKTPPFQKGGILRNVGC